ncbi:DUF6311 domain-containing protein [Myxococcus sp. K15C18031901]|uniref:DUF6311 domain-containing protein n=1 Tax=Myxococcus dinghuensis TaxID=2906761 RepID=UPI0020A6F549|nr:DUF6311 domain-containing protein [Myxococcus dinghuensis]MCP3102308.1 DUF6311 domain-containing protein [Myxococcus dinghuensis]
MARPPRRREPFVPAATWEPVPVATNENPLQSPSVPAPSAGLAPWVTALLGLLWYLAVGGGPTLDPTNLDWLGGDLSQHTLGWMHFRDAPWAFPLGRTPSLLTPLPMTVGFADANPWVSIALKPFSPWLPRDFQFIGPWLALCFMLQGWLGARLTSLFTSRVEQQVLGGALFFLAPVLLFRTGHDTLCAQWLLTAMLWLHLRPRASARDAWRSLAQALVVLVLASGIHPYLSVMVFALGVALLARLAWREQLLSWRAAAGALVVAGGVSGGLFFLLGYVGQGVSAGSHGFGFFSADLLTLVNAMDWSWLVPGLRTQPGQYEGFGYLGTGVLVLVLVALGTPKELGAWGKARLREHLPLVVCVLLLALLAFSSVLSVAGVKVLSLRKLFSPLAPLLGAVRASGRFIWPLHYAVVTGLLALTLARWRQRPALGSGLLLGVVLLQALDTRELWTRNHFTPAPWPRLQAPEWAQVDASYRHVVLFPTYVHLSESRCARSGFSERDSVLFADLAYRRHLTTNSGYPARVSEARVTEVCQTLQTDVEQGRLARDAIYVVDPARMALFRRLGDAVTCGVLDGFQVCVAEREGRFREALARTAPAGTSVDVPR